MAAAPSYASTPVTWAGLVPATADTSLTAPAHVTTLGTATSSGGSTGTKINEIDVIPVATTVAGLVNVFLYDGTSYHLHESVEIPVATVNATTAPVKQPL
jgi:hypothetical protein